MPIKYTYKQVQDTFTQNKCILISKNYENQCGKDCKKEQIYLSPTNLNTEWCNEYLFDYNNFNRERLLKIISN